MSKSGTIRLIGLGRSILDHLLAYLRTHAPDQAFADLFARRGTRPFYRQSGFGQCKRPVGMFRVTPIEGARDSE